LGYANAIQALIKNVDEDDKKKMDELGNLSERLPDPNARKTMFINESGLYSLIMRSEKPEATPLDSGLTIKRLASDGPSGSIFLVSLRPLCSMGGLLGL
jgi:prophage antirepressor-like protein